MKRRKLILVLVHCMLGFMVWKHVAYNNYCYLKIYAFPNYMHVIAF